jgi:hypothetical protein
MQYKLEVCGDGRYWGTPTWERYMKYREFEAEIHQPPPDPSSSSTNKQKDMGDIPRLFESMKRKRETRDDEKNEPPKKIPSKRKP